MKAAACSRGVCDAVAAASAASAATGEADAFHGAPAGHVAFLRRFDVASFLSVRNGAHGGHACMCQNVQPQTE